MNCEASRVGSEEGLHLRAQRRIAAAFLLEKRARSGSASSTAASKSALIAADAHAARASPCSPTISRRSQALARRHSRLIVRGENQGPRPLLRSLGRQRSAARPPGSGADRAWPDPQRIVERDEIDTARKARRQRLVEFQLVPLPPRFPARCRRA